MAWARDSWRGWMSRGVALAAALLLLGVATGAAEDRMQVAVGDSPALGPADAPITVVEFVDYQ
ncbi:MAG TPA: hypothetical protein VK997_01300 [Deferrisomatales bacterium]|nr:hypothetical protein [Deferrisomatales bacterium]